MKFKFNDIANAISVASGVTLAGIIAVGTYVFVNKDAIIEDIKEAAIESVMSGMGGGLTPKLPVGRPDLAPPDDQASIPIPSGVGLGVPNF
tara:strand:+ start:806 stop:1078 length:273 start_codon:yes stop_codon:yes gene_type:complete